jgi:hypothetical protein
MNNDKKNELALQVINGYGDLESVLGYERASKEMGHLLGEYVLRGELNEFEVHMIATLAILGRVATYALDENERFIDELQNN